MSKFDTPWTIKEVIGNTSIKTNDGRHILGYGTLHGNAVYSDIAAHIVECVNSHEENALKATMFDELVEALENHLKETCDCENGLTHVTMRDAIDTVDMECRFSNGEKYAAVQVCATKPHLAEYIYECLVTLSDREDKKPSNAKKVITKANRIKEVLEDE